MFDLEYGVAKAEGVHSTAQIDRPDVRALWNGDNQLAKDYALVPFEFADHCRRFLVNWIEPSNL